MECENKKLISLYLLLETKLGSAFHEMMMIVCEQFSIQIFTKESFYPFSPFELEQHRRPDYLSGLFFISRFVFLVINKIGVNF